MILRIRLSLYILVLANLVVQAQVKKLHKEADVIMEKHCLRKLGSCCLSGGAAAEHPASQITHAQQSTAPALGYNNIVRLHYTFQDSEYLYLISDYCE